MPRSYRRVVSAATRHRGNISQYERRIIGVDHSVAGRHLARQWKLGSTIEAAAWLSHQQAEGIPGSIRDRTIVEIVNLADTIARENAVGFSGNFKFTRSSGQLADDLSLHREIPAQIADCLGDEVDTLLERLATSVRPSDDPDPYRRTVGRANAALGRLNEELRLRNAELQTAAEAFSQLRQFASAVGPDASLHEVLGGIISAVEGAVGARATSAEPVLAYCCGYDADAATLAIGDGRDEPAFRTLAANVDFDPAAAVSPGEFAAASMAAVLADVNVLGQWIDLAIYRHYPIVCGRGRVGGVLCSAAWCSEDRTAALAHLAEVIAPCLALARGQDRAMRLGEQLAGAGEVLAATQEALAEARTLAAMGDMAAGAGHELNNPLAVISGRAQVMRQQAANDKERATWQQITEQSQRISDIISDLMDFASPRAAAPVAMDAEQLLREVVDTVRASGDPSVGGCEIIIEPPPAPLSVMADAAQTRIALREVVNNAAIATGEDARVTVSAEAGALNETVLFAITDNGPGMDAATRASVFTPFFSVQEAGRRCGLGLPRAQRYVANNGGKIWIESRMGEGTTAFIQLPRAPR